MKRIYVFLEEAVGGSAGEIRDRLKVKIICKYTKQKSLVYMQFIIEVTFSTG